MDLDIIILAAGKGTRMKSSLPKVMHKFLGEPFLEKVIKTATKLNPSQIIPIIGYEADIIKRYFKNKDLNFVNQKDQLGTGHAVIQAVPSLKSQHVMILYGDVPLVSENLIRDLYEESKKTGIAIVTYIKSNSSGYGRIIRGSNKIVKICEEKDCNEEQKKIKEINTGIMCVEKDKLVSWLSKLTNTNAQKEYYLTDIIEHAVDDDTLIKNIEAKNERTIQGINSIEELINLERAYMQDKAKDLIESGVKIQDPERIDIRGSLDCGENVSIDIGCIFEGKVVIEKDTHIGPYNVIKDCVVGKNNKLEAFNHLENAEIGNRCKIGPYARLRPETKVNNEINIGNFVEIKKSNINDQSKINHLSYIGDCKIGKNVNIGAGTITCNFDGAEKHQTIIEDDVFIGSDTQLIAPVVIKKGATIGAGSTIVSEAPKDKLTLSRSPQKNIDDWERPKKK